MSRDINLVFLEPAETPARGHRQRYFLGDDPREVSGAHSLVQLVVMTLLTEPGSHTPDPGWGVGIGRTLRRPFGDVDDVRSAAIVDVARAREQILSRQADERMPDDERLSDLTVQNAYRDAAGIVIALQVRTAAGSSVVLNSRDFIA